MGQGDLGRIIEIWMLRLGQGGLHGLGKCHIS